MSGEPDTTLETGAAPAEAIDRRAMLADQLGAIEDAAPEVADLAPELVETQPRGPDGKFAPKNADVADQTAVATAETAVADAPVDETVAPPPSWKKDYHEAFTKADPALRAYITQRETEMRQGIEPLIPKAKFFDDFNGVMQPFQQNIQASGVPPLEAVQSLMMADNILRNAPADQKQAYALQLLRQYNVDLSGIDWSQQAVDPRYATLERELHNLRNSITPIQQQHVQAQESAVLAEIEAFSKEKPHYEAVRPAMAQLLQSGQAATLGEAYEKAIGPWADVLAEAERGRQAAAKARERADADAAAKAARAAAVSVRSASPGAPTPTKAQDRRSMLSEQLDGLSERF